MPAKVRGAKGPRAVGAALGRSQAVIMRRAGATYSQIADELGVNTSTAWRYVSQALEELRHETHENALMLQELELQRLDQMQMVLWPRVLDGELAAIDRCLRVMADRRKLLGLDEPQRIEVAGRLMTESELDVAIADLLAAMAGAERELVAGPEGPALLPPSEPD